MAQIMEAHPWQCHPVEELQEAAVHVAFDEGPAELGAKDKPIVLIGSA
jgi:hypothetical protein